MSIKFSEKYDLNEVMKKSESSISISLSNSSIQVESKQLTKTKDQEIEELKNTVFQNGIKIDELESNARKDSQFIKASKEVLNSKTLIENLEKEFKELKKKKISQNQIENKMMEYQRRYKDLLKKKLQMSGLQYSLMDDSRNSRDLLNKSIQYQKMLESKNREISEKLGKIKIEIMEKDKKLKELQNRLKMIPQDNQSSSEEKKLLLKKQKYEKQLIELEQEFQLKENQLKQQTQELEKQKKDCSVYQEQINQQSQMNQYDISENQNKIIDDQSLEISKLTEENNRLLEQKYAYEDLLEKMKRQYQDGLEEKSNNFNVQLKEKSNENLLKQIEIKKCNQKIQELEWEIDKLKNTVNSQQKKIEERIKEFNLVNINLKSKDTEVKQILNQLNPQSQVNSSAIEFVKQLAIISQNPIALEKKKEIMEEDSKIMSLLNEHQTIKNKKFVPPAILKNYFSQNGVKVYLSNVTKETNLDKQRIQNTILFTGDYKQGKYISFKFEDPHILQSCLLNQVVLQNKINDLKSSIGFFLNIDEKQRINQIIVMRISLEPTPSIDLKINEQDENIEEKMKNFYSQGLSFEIKNLIDSSQISPDLFDSTFDTDWIKSKKGDFELRGSLPIYTDFLKSIPQKYFIPVGFKGYGLNVINKYGADKRWLDNNSNIDTWIVLFHGTSDKNVVSILTSYLKPGTRDLYSRKLCRITNTHIDSKFGNVYLSDQVDEAATYSNAEINGKKYYIVFQCRVSPRGVKSPAIYPSYYTVENPQEHIRPYRILFKEVD